MLEGSIDVIYRKISSDTVAFGDNIDEKSIISIVKIALNRDKTHSMGDFRDIDDTTAAVTASASALKLTQSASQNRTRCVQPNASGVGISVTICASAGSA